MDETYIRIKGKNAYLYREADSSVSATDLIVSKKRDERATEMIILEGRYYGDISCILYKKSEKNIKKRLFYGQLLPFYGCF